MTDEGQIGEPMDMVEVLNGMRNMASLAWGLFEALKAEGFTESQANEHVAAWFHGTAGGKLS